MTDHATEHGARPVLPVPLVAVLDILELHATGQSQYAQYGEYHAYRDGVAEVLPTGFIIKQQHVYSSNNNKITTMAMVMPQLIPSLVHE